MVSPEDEIGFCGYLFLFITLTLVMRLQVLFVDRNIRENRLLVDRLRVETIIIIAQQPLDCSEYPAGLVKVQIMHYGSRTSKCDREPAVNLLSG